MYILYIYTCIILSMRCLFCQLNLCDSFHRFVCSNYWVFYWLNTPCLILLACLILHLLHLNRQSIYLPLSLFLPLVILLFLQLLPAWKAAQFSKFSFYFRLTSLLRLLPPSPSLPVAILIENLCTIKFNSIKF